MNISNLMEFSLMDEEENKFSVPSLAQTPVVKNSILKPSTKDNLIQLSTPVHKNLKVKFQTPQTAHKVTPTRYEQIKELDDQENWAERTTVVLKCDHEENTKNAQAILHDLIYQVLDSKEESQVTPVTGPSLPMVSEETQDTGDDCKEKADNLSSQGHENVQQAEKETPSSPIIPAKSGAYSVDFDNLDTIDPFKNKGGLSSSPSSQKIEKITSEDNQAESDSEKLLEDIELPDIKLEDIADVTLSEYVLCEEGDTTVIENKHSGEGDITVDESKQTEDKDLTAIENKCKNEVDDISPKIEENKQLHDIDLENIKDPFATTKQLANSPQVNTTSGTSESTLVKENPFAALKSDIGLVESDGNSNFLNSPLKLPADSLVSEPNIINSPLLKSTENQPSIDEEMNPFATKTKVANSPAVSGDPFAPKSTVANSPSLDADPFATKSTVANSPAVAAKPFATTSPVANSPSLDADPFATKSTVANSPTLDRTQDPMATKSKVPNSPKSDGESMNTFDMKAELPKSPAQSTQDLFATKTKVANSPGINSNENPFETKSKVTSSPTIGSEENPFATKSMVPNSQTVISEVDPFATKSNVPNSPAINTEVDPFASKAKVPNSPALKSLEEDPFTTKPKVPNSPALKSSEDDPFTTKPNVSNSPAISAEADPFATKTKVPNSPAISTDADPFATKTKVPNSPALKSSEDDPFTAKPNVSNSPAISAEADPFATKTKVSTSPLKKSDDDPFTTKSMVPNSPAVSSEDPFATKTKIPNSPVVSSEEDPFATKTKVPNSPVVKTEEDPFATNTNVPNSPAVKTKEDPFATKTKVPNSPLRNSDNDPFTSKSKVPNSPVVNQKENPFASKSKVPNSPTISTEEDPFATNLKVANLPAINSKDDPFATKSKVPISPTTSSEENPFAPKSKIENSLSKNLDDIDPFATKSKVPSSPKNDEVKIQDSLKQAIGADAFLNNNPFSPQCPAVNITSKRGATELSGKQDGGLLNLGLSIDEDQFKPACDVFNDTASWDALESFGSCTSDPSTLNRQSLYVKFDPLVNLPPDDPRRASIDIRRASMKLERLREINSDESFLLFGTPPKSSSVRNVGIVSQGQLDGGAKKKTPAKTPVQELKKSAVDLLSDSPDILSMSINVNRLGEQAEGIKMNLADVQDSDSGIVEVLQYTEADWKKMQHALLMEVQGKILAKEREYALIKKQYEDQMKKIMEEHKTELASRDEKAKKNAKSFDEIMVILAEYEKTIDNLIGEKEKLKEEKDEEIKKLKDKIQQLNTDEQSVETTLSLLHQRYEKLKTVLQGYITNEETLKKYGDECTAKVKATEEKMQALKKDAEAKLQKANTENETLKSEAEAEGSKLKVALKRKEMECQRKENEKQSLQSQIEQKIQENTELTSLCDELLSKVK